ncbi:MAG TPA: heme exporter protein CcmB [Acidimicrobiales bacterium]|nr:heme exporter protein CcmB [Acidimicrobiales bacterium]
MSAEVWRAAALVAGKDLRIERRARVGAQQVAPFALVVLVLFAFAFDANHTLLRQAAPGLFWVAVLFAGVLGVQRSFSLEAADGARDGLRLTGMDPAGIFLGKAGALAGQLVVLEAVLAAGVAVLYSTSLRGGGLLVLTCALATVGLAAAGTVYGVVAASVGVSETLLPLLLLPVLAPVLLAATKAWSDALTGAPGAWGWMRILGVFAVVYVAAGVLAFGPLLEES